MDEFWKQFSMALMSLATIMLVTLIEEWRQTRRYKQTKALTTKEKTDDAASGN